MTQFCTWNIPTVFGTQFLSFPISTAKKCFGWILTTFSGPDIFGVGKVENRVRMTRFSTRSIPTLFRVQFVLFHVNTAEKCFGLILTTFPSSDTIGAGKVESEAWWLDFSPKTYPNCLGSVLIISCPYGWKTFRSNFEVFSRVVHHRSRPSAGKVVNQA